MSYRIIETHRVEGSIETQCRALGVSVSGYYAWQGRQPSWRQQLDALLLTQIRAVYQAGRGLYGSPARSCRFCASAGSSAHASGWHA